MIERYLLLRGVDRDRFHRMPGATDSLWLPPLPFSPVLSLNLSRTRNRSKQLTLRCLLRRARPFSKQAYGETLEKWQRKQ